MPVQTPEVRHHYTTGAAGNRLHYVDYGGSGQPLICLHGVTGSAWTWYAVATGLTEYRRVLALDFRGFGDSQWSASADYRTSDHVADLGALVGTLGTERVDLMGSSWGALVAIEYAAECPQNVGRLVVVDVEPSFEQGETDLFPRPVSYNSATEVQAAEAQRHPHASEEMTAVMAATGYMPTTGGVLAPKHDPFFFERWPFRSDDHWDQLGRIEAPTLFLHAGNSFVRGDVMSEMTARVSESSYVEVAQSSHVMPVDNPQGLVAAVRPFLATTFTADSPPRHGY